MPSEIEWTDETWNPITGCTKISAGCQNCYAEKMARRLAGRFGYPEAPHHFDVTVHPDKLEEPLHWKKPRTIFVCSMGDFFHPQVSLRDQTKIFNVIRQCPQHTFLVLTKRAEQMAMMEHAAGIPRLDNLWLGVTAENQQAADKRIPLLLETPAAKRWVSLEPMLGPVDLAQINYEVEYYNSDDRPAIWNALKGEILWDERRPGGYLEPCGEPAPALELVVIGTESGPNRRPAKIEWMRDVMEQCQEAGVPCFVKQVEIDGHVSHDPQEWPEELRVREMPEGGCNEHLI